jgi:hypothetical protein
MALKSENNPEQTESKGSRYGPLTCCLKLFVAFLIYIFAPFFLFGPELGEKFEEGSGILVMAIFFSPWVQLIRLPLLKVLLGKAKWNASARDIAIVDWAISLFTGALIATPLVNLFLRSDTGSVFAVESNRGILYGQLMFGNYEFGIPDYFIALAFAILVDLLILWGSLNRFRKADFRLSLRTALTVNAAIYVPVTLLFLTPYFFNKLGW